MPKSRALRSLQAVQSSGTTANAPKPVKAAPPAEPPLPRGLNKNTKRLLKQTEY
jgi:hypothetical protein